MSAIELEWEFFKGGYAITNDMFEDGDFHIRHRSPHIQKQLDVLNCLNRIVYESSAAKKIKYNDVTDLCSKLKIPLYHVLAFNFNAHDIDSKKNRIQQMVQQRKVERLVDASLYTKNVTGEVVNAVKHRYDTKSSHVERPLNGLQAFYTQRFQTLIDSLVKSNHFFEKYLILSEAVNVLNSRAPPTISTTFFVHEKIIELLLKTFYILNAEIKHPNKVGIECDRITHSWCRVMVVNTAEEQRCSTLQQRQQQQQQQQSLDILSLSIEVVVRIVFNFYPNNGERLVYVVNRNGHSGEKRSADDQNSHLHKDKCRKSYNKAYAKNDTPYTRTIIENVSDQTKLDNLLLKKIKRNNSCIEDEYCIVRKKTKPNGADNYDDNDICNNNNNNNNRQTFHRTHDNSITSFVTNEKELLMKEQRPRSTNDWAGRLLVKPKSKYTKNAYLHGLHSHGIKTMAVDESQSLIYHINNQVIHIPMYIRDNNKFINVYKQKSLVKGMIMKTDNMTVSFYKIATKDGCLMRDVIFSINISGYAESLRLGLLQLKRVGKDSFTNAGDIRVSYTCATIRSPMTDHTNPLSFRPKLKNNEFWFFRKIENFPVVCGGPPGKANLIHKGAILSRCKDSSYKKRLRPHDYEAGCKCKLENFAQRKTNSSSSADRRCAMPIEGICGCVDACCVDQRLEVTTSCLKDIKNVIERPFGNKWSTITFKMEKARGELSLTCVDTGIKLGMLLFPSKTFNYLQLINDNRKIIQSRHLFAQCDTFSSFNLSCLHGGVAQISHLPLAYASKKNAIDEAAIKYRPSFFKRLEEVFGTDVGINASKSIVKITGSCNIFVKLPNVSNVVFYSPLFSAIVDKMIGEFKLMYGDSWKDKFPDTYLLLKEIKIEQENDVKNNYKHRGIN